MGVLFDSFLRLKTENTGFQARLHGFQCHCYCQLLIGKCQNILFLTWEIGIIYLYFRADKRMPRNEAHCHLTHYLAHGKGSESSCFYDLCNYQYSEGVCYVLLSLQVTTALTWKVCCDSEFTFSHKCSFIFPADLKGAEEFCTFLSECIFIQNALHVEATKLRSWVMQHLVWPAVHLK